MVHTYGTAFALVPRRGRQPHAVRISEGIPDPQAFERTEVRVRMGSAEGRKGEGEDGGGKGKCQGHGRVTQRVNSARGLIQPHLSSSRTRFRGGGAGAGTADGCCIDCDA